MPRRRRGRAMHPAFNQCCMPLLRHTAGSVWPGTWGSWCRCGPTSCTQILASALWLLRFFLQFINLLFIINFKRFHHFWCASQCGQDCPGEDLQPGLDCFWRLQERDANTHHTILKLRYTLINSTMVVIMLKVIFFCVQTRPEKLRIYDPGWRECCQGKKNT